MIPISVFTMMVALLIPLFLYSFIDNENKYYGNIIAAFLCAIVAAYLAVIMGIGIVEYNPTVITNSSWQWSNTTHYDAGVQGYVWTNVTVLTATCAHCNNIVQDASLGYMLLLISMVMMAYSLLMVYGAYEDYKRQKEEI